MPKTSDEPAERRGAPGFVPAERLSWSARQVFRMDDLIRFSRLFLLVITALAVLPPLLEPLPALTTAWAWGYFILVRVVVPLLTAAAAVWAAWLAQRATWILVLALPVAVIISTALISLRFPPDRIGIDLMYALPVMFSAFLFRLRTAAALSGFTVLTCAVFSFIRYDPYVAGHVSLFAFCSLLGMGAVMAGLRRQVNQAQTTLQRLAGEDPLTGLAPRLIYDQELPGLVERAVRGAGGSLLLVDADHFKSVNDRWGHPGGDLALTRLARVLTETLPADGRAWRIGGDEFALWVPGDASLGLEVAQALRARVAGDRGTDPDLVAVTSVSVGAAFAPDQGRTARELFVAADADLYRAKRSGRAGTDA